MVRVVALCKSTPRAGLKMASPGLKPIPYTRAGIEMASLGLKPIPYTKPNLKPILYSKIGIFARTTSA